MRAAAFVRGVVALVASLGCSTGARSGDAGAEGDGPAGPLIGQRSFVVTSTVMQQPTGGGGSVPLGNNHRFTMMIDVDARLAVVGANGSATMTSFNPTAAGGAIGDTGSISVGNGVTVSYRNLSFTVDAAGALSGTGEGYALYPPPNTDIVSSVLVTATLQGVPDTEAPAFGSGASGARIDAFARVTITASEPLPANTRLALVDQSGDRLDVVPAYSGAIAAASFAPSPSRMWRYNDQYSLLTDGVIDLAGNPISPSNAIVFTTGAAPQLVAEDGFESTTGPTLAGAQVLSGSDAPTISGTRSLYVPPFSGSAPPMAQTTQFALRLTLSPGDSVVRFSFRTVNPSSFDNSRFLMASEGGVIASPTLPPDSEPPTAATIPGQGQVMLGPLMTAAFPLAADATGEITLSRILPGSSGHPPPPAAGLIIDDLRAE